MNQDTIKPERITKPMQLLGAWLVGLLTIDVAFLTAAANIEESSWQSGALVVAAIANVPVFIGALFLLQTKFRPELQEDSYYATYLGSRSNEPIKVSRLEARLSKIEFSIDSLSNLKLLETAVESEGGDISHLDYGVNINLPDHVEILEKLATIGVRGVSEFGHTSGPPTSRKIAISESISKSQRDIILSMALDMGFTHFDFIKPFEEIREDVLIGAYIPEGSKIILRPA